MCILSLFTCWVKNRRVLSAHFRFCGPGSRDHHHKQHATQRGVFRTEDTEQQTHTHVAPEGARSPRTAPQRIRWIRGYLFATSSGKPVDVSNFYKWSWRPALRRAGLPETLTPHQLRHGTASLLLNQNVPVPVVSRYLGHANPGITMKVYAHMIDGTSGMAADGIDSALGD